MLCNDTCLLPRGNRPCSQPKAALDIELENPGVHNNAASPPFLGCSRSPLRALACVCVCVCVRERVTMAPTLSQRKGSVGALDGPVSPPQCYGNYSGA